MNRAPTVTHPPSPMSHILVVECDEADEWKLPKPSHRLDYQTGTLRFEYPDSLRIRTALRLCGVTNLPKQEAR